MRDAQALTTTPVSLVLLAELAGLDWWDFTDQIGEPVTGPWISLVSEDPPDPDTPGPEPVPAVRPRTWWLTRWPPRHALTSSPWLL